MQKLFHQHLLIKAYVNNPPTSEDALNDWLTRLVAAINMKVVIPARSKYVVSEGNRGLTGQVGLETSHAAIHVWDDVVPGMLQMDVYSCSCFDTETVVDMIKEWDLISYEAMTIDRNDNFVVESIEKIDVV
jgi:S-adenosylmethionine/arginine decarboxylase-like enzyme